MPPSLAFVLTLAFILYLFLQEATPSYKPSRALWIPTMWLLILGSRSVTEWLSLGQPLPTESSIQDGSPLDRNVFTALMVAGLIVLVRRGISWAHLFQSNVWLALFVLYCGISVTWSDFPDVAFKRWLKALGEVIMVLVILSDPQPLKAIGAIVNRCAYVLIPMSVLFIKYYPAYGRRYSEWTGDVTYTGVTTNKNMIGYLCFVCGLFLIFRFFKRGPKRIWREDRKEFMISATLLCMTAWLMSIADAKTALMCLFISSGVSLALGYQSFRNHLGAYLASGLVAFVVFHLWLGVTEAIISGLGRDTTLTGRTELWPRVLSMVRNPIGGEGFESFWLGYRLEALQAAYYFRPNQAHNGYIEVYLNLGVIGLVFLAGIVGVSYRNLRQLLLESFKTNNAEVADFARIATGYLVAYLIFNVTDASFRPLHLLYIMFLMVTIRFPQPWPITFPAISKVVSPLPLERLKVPDSGARSRVYGFMISSAKHVKATR